MSDIKKTIMVVDDDAALRKLYNVELSTKGFNVVEAADGKEALSRIETEHPDLILLDLVMPNLDGVGLLTEMKNHDDWKGIPVIMLTNFGQENLVKQAYDLGVSDFLLKYKVTQEEMAQKISQTLSGGA